MTAHAWLALAAKLEAASGPDAELDHVIAASAGLIPERMSRKGNYYSEDISPGYRSWTCPKFTASVDAILHLIGERLPGARWEVTTTGFKPGASIVSRGGPMWSEGSYAATPALALTAATCRAMAVRQTEERRDG